MRISLHAGNQTQAYTIVRWLALHQPHLQVCAGFYSGLPWPPTFSLPLAPIVLLVLQHGAAVQARSPQLRWVAACS